MMNDENLVKDQAYVIEITNSYYNFNLYCYHTPTVVIQRLPVAEVVVARD